MCWGLYFAGRALLHSRFYFCECFVGKFQISDRLLYPLVVRRMGDHVSDVEVLAEWLAGEVKLHQSRACKISLEGNV